MAACLACVAGGASAQVVKCEVGGKVVYQDSPCEGGTKSREVVSRSQQQAHRSADPIDAEEAKQRNLDSYRRATEISRSITESALQSGGGGSAGVIGYDANERIRAQDQRNMQRRQAEIDAAQAEAQRRAAAQEWARQQGGPPMPTRVGNCNSGGCWGADGKRYNLTSSGKFLSQDGRLCNMRGNQMVCH